MALDFQPRTDGYRVVELDGNGKELRMVAAVQTRQVMQSPPETMPDELYAKVKAASGETEALKARDQWAKDRKDGVTIYEDLPRAQCSVHGSSGPLGVADLDEILASDKLPKV